MNHFFEHCCQLTENMCASMILSQPVSLLSLSALLICYPLLRLYASQNTHMELIITKLHQPNTFIDQKAMCISPFSNNTFAMQQSTFLSLRLEAKGCVQ